MTDIDALLQVMIAHLARRYDPSTGQPSECSCGHWYQLGEFIPRHLAEEILKAGFTQVLGIRQ